MVHILVLLLATWKLAWFLCLPDLNLSCIKTKFLRSSRITVTKTYINFRRCHFALLSFIALKMFAQKLVRTWSAELNTKTVSGERRIEQSSYFPCFEQWRLSVDRGKRSKTQSSKPEAIPWHFPFCLQDLPPAFIIMHIYKYTSKTASVYRF